MQVFKSYFKILNKKKGSMLMYIGIFAGIIFGFILPNSGKTEDEYKSMKCKFAWFDYDHTEESEELFSYLDHAHKHAELKTDTTEAMQDSLFNRNTDCIVRIKKGYADHLDKEDLSDYIEIVAIPNRSKVELFESDVNKYISYLNAYFAAGYDRAEAATQVNELFQTRTNVTMTTENHGGKHSTRYTFFSYLGWILVVMMIEGVSPVLIVYDKKELRERIASSAYKYSNMTKEILLGTIVTGFLGCAVFAVGGCFVFRKEMFTAAGLGNLLNMVCYMFVAMEPCWIRSNQIEAARVAMTRYIKRGGKVWIKIFPDKPITAKPAETRMGSGKGTVEYWAAVVKPGRVMFEIAGVPEETAREALRLAMHKLPCKCKIVSRADLEGGDNSEN